MNSLKGYIQKSKGFTIVELLIVIVVIGILAALVITTFSGVQNKARDTERETDIKALHGQLEAYYAAEGGYPSLTDINTASWRTTNMKGLDAEALKDPDGTATTLASAAAANVYSYVATPAGCATNACTGYVLTATKEDASTYVKNSLN